jgi:nitroreductase/FMN reductase [NAD(P)H]
LSRRVCRRFSGEPIPEALLETLLACAQSAPSKSDLQQYSIIVVEDPEKRAKIAGWIGDAWVGEAPLILVFCGDLRRGRRIAAMKGLPHDNDTVDMLVNATADAALAMMAFIVAAEASGLGCCPLSLVRNRIYEAAEMLALPDGVYPWAGLCVGWPAATRDVSMRLPPSVVVHRERYDDSDLEAALPAYDAARPPAKPRYPEIHGPKPEGCTWSENSARQLSVPERFGLSVWLKSRGIDLA